MAVETHNSTNDDTDIGDDRIYAVVEHFAVTGDRPEGISGIAAINPDGSDSRWSPWQGVEEGCGSPAAEDR